MTGAPRRWVVLGAACVVQLALGAVYVWSIFGAALGPGSAIGMHLSAGQAMEPFEAALGMIVFGAALGGWLQDRMGPCVVALTGGLLYSGSRPCGSWPWGRRARLSVWDWGGSRRWRIVL